MKTKLLIILSLIFFVSCTQEEHTKYFSNGTIKEEVETVWDDGSPSALQISYYNSNDINSFNQVKEKWLFKKGKPHGKNTTYYRNGNIKSVVIWRKGEIVNSFYYNEDGKLR